MQKEAKPVLGSKDRKFSVMEIFRTVQGEGTDLGRETIFMRLAVCNLQCVWCDTKDSWTKAGAKEFLTIDEIVERFHNLDPAHELTHYVITGGEPLLHDHDLLAELMGKLAVEGWRYGTFETNGTVIPAERLVKATWLFSVSPKLASSGNGEYPLKLYNSWVSTVNKAGSLQFKFVIGDQTDAYEAIDLVSKGWYYVGMPIIFQPEESANNYKELPDLIGRAFNKASGKKTKADFNIRYIPQVHKMTGWR